MAWENIHVGITEPKKRCRFPIAHLLSRPEYEEQTMYLLEISSPLRKYPYRYVLSVGKTTRDVYFRIKREISQKFPRVNFNGNRIHIVCENLDEFIKTAPEISKIKQNLIRLKNICIKSFFIDENAILKLKKTFPQTFVRLDFHKSMDETFLSFKYSLPKKQLWLYPEFTNYCFSQTEFLKVNKTKLTVFIGDYVFNRENRKLTEFLDCFLCLMNEKILHVEKANIVIGMKNAFFKEMFKLLEYDKEGNLRKLLDL